MRNVQLNGKNFQLIKSRIYPGSVKKSELILQEFRKYFKREGFQLTEKFIWKLRLSNSRRSQFLASFLNYFFKDFNKIIRQIYIEKANKRKKFKFKSKRVKVLIRDHFRFVLVF